jgi:hypothetical protein
MNLSLHAHALRLSPEAGALAAPGVQRLPSRGDGNGGSIRGGPFGDSQSGATERKARN